MSSSRAKEMAFAATARAFKGRTLRGVFAQTDACAAPAPPGCAALVDLPDRFVFACPNTLTSAIPSSRLKNQKRQKKCGRLVDLLLSEF